MASRKRAEQAAREERVRVQARERKRRQRAKVSAAAPLSVGGARRSAKPDEKRVASRGKRDPFSRYNKTLPNPDPSLRKFGKPISYYTDILHQFPNVAGYCKWSVEHVLANEIMLKPAKADTTERQTIADGAVDRMKRAWSRVQNRDIVLQSLLMGEYYGFARAEMVARFDEVVKEWVPDLYDVSQEAWIFDDDGASRLVTRTSFQGVPVDDSKFIHYLAGSADTKYGHALLACAITTLWKMQQLEEYALQSIEDYGRPLPIVHIPRDWEKPERVAYEASLNATLRAYLTAPTTESKSSIEMPTGSMAASGAAGRQEFEAIGRYETHLQILILGAPQTGNRSLGTGKLEETRSDVWDDKTPLMLSALDRCLNASWRDTYCSWNLADVPVELWPSFESDSSTVAEGLTGIAAQTVMDVLLKFAARQITSVSAIDVITGVGYPRARAVAMVQSTEAERDKLVTVATSPTNAQPIDMPSTDPSQPEPPEDPAEEDEDASV